MIADTIARQTACTVAQQTGHQASSEFELDVNKMEQNKKQELLIETYYDEIKTEFELDLYLFMVYE